MNQQVQSDRRGGDDVQGRRLCQESVLPRALVNIEHDVGDVVISHGFQELESRCGERDDVVAYGDRRDGFEFSRFPTGEYVAQWFEPARLTGSLDLEAKLDGAVPAI